MVDTSLVIEAQSGNQEAFSRLVTRYSGRIYTAAYSFLRNMDDASDIVQEVFIRAYRNISSFDSVRPLYPWLYRIARNLCINKVKNMNSRNVSLPEWELRARTDDPETRYMKQQEADAVLHAMKKLPEKFREIIELKHFQECSYQEIAEILDIPVGTVMSRLYNARMKLKDELSKEER